MIKCELRDIPAVKGPEMRKGRYHRSNFWDVKGFGKERWIVGAYIDFNGDDFPPWFTETEIVEGCLVYLNTPPPRKKYEKALTHSLYGKLSTYQYTFKRDSGGSPYIEVMLITDERTNNNFWGKGKSDKF